MFNVLLEHFVVSPEILCLKQRMFFVLFFAGVCFLFEKNMLCHCGLQSFYRNGRSSLQNLFYLNLEKARCKPQKVAFSDGEKLFVGRFLQMH